MASLQVDDLIFHFATVRTEEFSVTPVMDPSGKHFECSRIDLSIVAVVADVAAATGKRRPAAVGAGFEGDRLPYSMNRLVPFLTTPRRHVKYVVGGVTILDLPQLDRNGRRLSCDPKGGPFCRTAKFAQIAGDQSAVLTYAVTCYDSRSPNYVLSHAWDVQSSLDEHGYTTRVTAGTARFRKDFLDARRVGGDVNEQTLQPDFFRKALFPVCPSDMRRVHVEVTQPRSADEVSYVVVDKEVTFGLGRDDDCVKVDGTVTAYSSYAIKSTKSAAGLGVSVGLDALAQNADDILKKVLDAAIPQSTAVGVVRAYGRKGADRKRLAHVAKAFVLDRFWPVLKQANAFGQDPNSKLPQWSAISGVAVSHSVHSEEAPWAEVRLDLFLTNPYVLDFTRQGINTGGPIFDTLFNLSDEYGWDRGGKLASPTTLSGPHLPAAGNTRGTWIARLVSQALRTAAQADAHNLPDVPPEPKDSVDYDDLA